MIDRSTLKTFLKKIINYILYIHFPWKVYLKKDIDNGSYKNDNKRYIGYSENDKFVNIGAGSFFYHPRWDCLDFYQEGKEGTHAMYKVSDNYIPWDFTNAKPLPDIYKLAYCAHVFEHIPAHAIDVFVSNICNSLEAGGILRVMLPDADLGYNAYSDNRYDYFEIYESHIHKSRLNIDESFYIEFLLLDYFATAKTRNFSDHLALDIRRAHKQMNKVDFLNFLIKDIDSNTEKGMDHVNWFDFEKIYNILKKAGFSKVYKSAYGQSISPVMRDVTLFDEYLPGICLFVEAIK